MKKILITGGAGFFSSRFKERFKDKYEIFAATREELDITDKEKVVNVCNDFKPDYVIHAAAIAVTNFCNENPNIAHKINVEGAINVAKASKMISAKLIFISTEQVFNGNKEIGPYSEEDKAIPDTVYGENKLECEKLLKDIIDELWIVRFTWLFGMSERNMGMASNIMWDTIKALIKNEKIYASPNEFRGMTYVEEMIVNIEKIISEGRLPYGIYNLGSENDMSRYETVKFILKELGVEGRLDYILIKDEEKYKAKPRDIRLNTKKAREYGLNFSTTRDGIKKCISEFKLR